MKKKIIALTLLLTCALTGCTTGEDFISEVVRDNNYGMAVYSNHLDKLTMPESVRLGEDDFYGISEAIMESSMGKYAYIDEDIDQFTIDVESYVCDFAEENGKEIITLGDEDRRKWFYEDETLWDNYQWVLENDIMYVENNEGQIVGDKSFMLISKNEAIKDALISNGYEWVYDIYKSCDDLTLAEFENDKFLSPYYVKILNQCTTFYSYDAISINMTDVNIPLGAEYLVELCQRDGWIIEHAGANESCESLTMTYDGTWRELRVDLFGKDGVVKEIKFTYDKTLNTITESAQFTITGCMKALGCSDDTIAEFLKQMPTKSGNIDNLYFVVENIDEDNGSIKLYTK